MKCPSCQREAGDGKFCRYCGQPLAREAWIRKGDTLLHFEKTSLASKLALFSTGLFLVGSILLLWLTFSFFHGLAEEDLPVFLKLLAGGMFLVGDAVVLFGLYYSISYVKLIKNLPEDGKVSIEVSNIDCVEIFTSYDGKYIMLMLKKPVYGTRRWTLAYVPVGEDLEAALERVKRLTDNAPVKKSFITPLTFFNVVKETFSRG